MKQDIISLANKKVGDIELDEAVFGVDVRSDLLARMVNWQLAKRRAGTHKVKTRSEITASKTKPFRQKGSGRARQGFKAATQMRGGGVVFGPTPRDHSHKLPKKVRRLALKSALTAKVKEGKFVVLDEAKLKAPKTNELAKQVEKLGWGRTLIIDGPEVDTNFAKAAGNLIDIDLLPSVGANVYDILRRDTLVLTKAGVEQLTERLK